MLDEVRFKKEERMAQPLSQSHHDYYKNHQHVIAWIKKEDLEMKLDPKSLHARLGKTSQLQDLVYICYRDYANPISMQQSHLEFTRALQATLRHFQVMRSKDSQRAQLDLPSKIVKFIPKPKLEKTA